jgi:hypothetical protein
VEPVTFLSDGTPVRFVGLNVKKPLQQQVITACIGSTNAFVACSLPLGKRVEFTNWVIDPRLAEKTDRIVRLFDGRQVQ